MKFAFLFAAFALAMLLVPPVFAGCSQNSYLGGCSACQYDNATGKFDRSCTDAKKNEGIACLGASYPIAMNNYRAGNCTQVEDCISQLNSCTSTASSGNEKADCEEGSMSTCYAAADMCFERAAAKCSNLPPVCPSGISIIAIGGAVALYAAYLGRKAAACDAPAKC